MLLGLALSEDSTMVRVLNFESPLYRVNADPLTTSVLFPAEHVDAALDLLCPLVPDHLPPTQRHGEPCTGITGVSALHTQDRVSGDTTPRQVTVRDQGFTEENRGPLHVRAYVSGLLCPLVPDHLPSTQGHGEPCTENIGVRALLRKDRGHRMSSDDVFQETSAR